jgi:hypothetical protein
MTSDLQHEHGTALVLWVNDNILTAAVSGDAGLDADNAARMKLASHVLIAFSYHLLNKPITSAAMVEAGGGPIAKVNYGLASLVSIGVLDAKSFPSDTGGRIYHYHFTDTFTAKINEVQATLVTVH